jgi:hypothetical protein
MPASPRSRGAKDAVPLTRKQSVIAGGILKAVFKPQNGKNQMAAEQVRRRWGRARPVVARATPTGAGLQNRRAPPARAEPRETLVTDPHTSMPSIWRPMHPDRVCVSVLVSLCSQKASVVAEINSAFLTGEEASTYSVEKLESWIGNALYRWRCAQRGHRPASWVTTLMLMMMEMMTLTMMAMMIIMIAMSVCPSPLWCPGETRLPVYSAVGGGAAEP